MNLDDWVSKSDGSYEKVINANEPVKLVEEEILIPQKDGTVSRKLVRRKYDLKKDSKLRYSDKMLESSSSGNIIVARRVLENDRSILPTMQPGAKPWKENSSGNLE